MTTVCGSGERAIRQGKSLTEAGFYDLTSICIDPIRPANFYAGDRSSIRYVDTETDSVSLVAGSGERGNCDGFGAAARFAEVRSLICARGGDMLYVCDRRNHKIRSVNTKTKSVATVVMFDSFMAFPRKVVFDRSELSLFVIASNLIHRLELGTKQLTVCLWGSGAAGAEIRPEPQTIDITSSGQIIVFCSRTKKLYTFDPEYRELTALAGCDESGSVDGPGSVASFRNIEDMVVMEQERCAYLVEFSDSCIRRITLPASLFV